MGSCNALFAILAGGCSTVQQADGTVVRQYGDPGKNLPYINGTQGRTAAETRAADPGTHPDNNPAAFVHWMQPRRMNPEEYRITKAWADNYLNHYRQDYRAFGFDNPVWARNMLAQLEQTIMNPQGRDPVELKSAQAVLNYFIPTAMDGKINAGGQTQQNLNAFLTTYNTGMEAQQQGRWQQRSGSYEHFRESEVIERIENEGRRLENRQDVGNVVSRVGINVANALNGTDHGLVRAAAVAERLTDSRDSYARSLDSDERRAIRWAAEAGIDAARRVGGGRSSGRERFDDKLEDVNDDITAINRKLSRERDRDDREDLLEARQELFDERTELTYARNRTRSGDSSAYTQREAFDEAYYDRLKRSGLDFGGGTYGYDHRGYGRGDIEIGSGGAGIKIDGDLGRIIRGIGGIFDR